MKTTILGGFESYHVSNTVEYLAPCDVQSNYDNYGNDEHSKWKHLAPMNIRRYSIFKTYSESINYKRY